MDSVGSDHLSSHATQLNGPLRLLNPKSRLPRDIVVPFRLTICRLPLLSGIDSNKANFDR